MSAGVVVRACGQGGRSGHWEALPMTVPRPTESSQGADRVARIAEGP